MVSGKAGNALLAYQTAQALNATRMRILVQWSGVTAGDGGAYEWGAIDNAIDAAALYGMRTQLDLTGPAPTNAAGLYKGLRIRRPNPTLYGDFVRAAAEHFKGRIDRYSIWNEPNYPAWLAPQRQSPALYRKLYVAGYRAVKSVDPKAQVLIGETVPYGGTVKGKRLGLATPPLEWLRDLACVDARYRRIGRCRPLKADGYAHHPYEFTTAPTARRFPGADNAPIQTLGRLRTALRKLARARALSAPGGRPARWLPEQFQVAARQPGVNEMLQYNVFVPIVLPPRPGGTPSDVTSTGPPSGGVTPSGGGGAGAPSGGTAAPPSSGGGSPGGGGGGQPPSGSGGGTPSGGGGSGAPPQSGNPPTTTPPPASCKVMIGSICVVP
jgi:hypothetical protein